MKIATDNSAVCRNPANPNETNPQDQMLIADVLSSVAAYYGLQMMDLTGPSRKLLLARQRGMDGVVRGSKNGKGHNSDFLCLLETWEAAVSYSATIFAQINQPIEINRENFRNEVSGSGAHCDQFGAWERISRKAQSPHPPPEVQRLVALAPCFSSSDRGSEPQNRLG